MIMLSFAHFIVSYCHGVTLTLLINMYESHKGHPRPPLCKAKPVMAQTHCTGPEQGKGQGPRLGTIGFYIMLYTVHTTERQGQGIIVFYCAHLGPSSCPSPGPVQCV